MFDTYWSAFLSLGVLNFLALVYPGPDFLVTFRNSVFHSRKAGIFTALGIALGETFHLTYILCGVGVLVSQNIWILYTVKIIGSGYLIYLGWKALCAKKMTLNLDEKPEKELSPSGATLTGFITSAVNPNTILFFLSIFMVVISPGTPPMVLAAYGIEIVLMTFAFFVLVAFCFSTQRVVDFFHRFGQWVERLTGGVLISLGIKLAFMNLK